MFADNQKISWLQAARQFSLVFLGPALFWITAEIKGRNGLYSVILGSALLVIWLFFLLRHIHVYRYPQKYWGKSMSRVLGVIYQGYLLLTGGFLVAKIAEVLTVYLIPGIPFWEIAGLVTLIALGAGQNAEARGRFAQTVWPLVAGLAGSLLFLAALQGKPEFLLTGKSGRWEWTAEDAKEVLKGTGIFFCAFLGVGVFPFLEIQGRREEGSCRSIFWMIGKIGVWLGAAIVILQAAFGENGMENLRYPVMDLMSGVQFPGNFLQRVDLIFLAVIVFSMLFALGSVFFYSGYIGERMRLGKGRIGAATLSFLLGTWGGSVESWTENYGKIVSYIFLPLFLTILVCTEVIRRKNYEKKVE